MSFKARILSVIFTAAALVMGVFLFIGYFMLEVSEERFSDEAIRGKTVLWQKVIQVQQEHMEASTSSLTRASDVLKALRNSKIDELKEAVKPTFNRLSSSEIINRLQIADKNGNIVYSSPQEYSGETKKILVKQAIEQKQVFKGVELDDDGKLIIEVAFPLYYRGKLAGAGIFMIEPQKAIEDFKSVDGSEVHLFSLDDKLEFTTNQEQFEMNSHVHHTMPEPTQYKQEVGEQIMSMAQLPILDASGQLIANLMTFTDYTDSYSQQSNISNGGFLGVLITFSVVMIFMYWFIVRAFKPLDRIMGIMKHISAGDLTDDIVVDCPGEFGLLMSGLQGMQDKLRTMIVDINAATQQIENSAGSLDRVSHESSQRVDNQTRITNQLVDNIDELIQASNEVSGSAEDTKNETVKADAEVTNGRTVIGNVVQTIKTISEQVNRAEQVVQNVQNDTESIGAVLGVIKGIAEQTNLLALNAAIEAARAGEQGRGFAVVADEVRTLASRTQESTREIESMIDALQKGASDAVSKMSASISMVEKGVEIANEADQSFNNIAGTVSSVNQKSIHISSAANNQMTLSRTMHDNVQSINSAAEEAVVGNNSSVQSTEELIKLAENLKQKVSQFRT